MGLSYPWERAYWRLHYLDYKGLVLFFLCTKTNKRETRFNNHGNPGPGSTTIMFGKKSNLCRGQNAFLSHYSQSLLKACQEINETRFVQLPTSMHWIQQSLASPEMQCKVKLKRTHRLGRGSVPVELCAVGTLAPRALASLETAPPPSSEGARC